MSKITSLILIRHGQSQWNLENLFTGWEDVNLTDQGIFDAKKAGLKIKSLNISFDEAFCSVLKRSIQTLEYILKELNLTDLRTTQAWQLNERHYGALQGLNKKDTQKKYGSEQVHIWRRSYDIAPPKKSQSPSKDQILKYQALGLDQIPESESLKMTQDRVIPYFESKIKPLILKGKNLLIVAHGNSLRALTMKLENLSEQAITKLEIETATPIVYTLSCDDLSLIKKDILTL